MNAALWKHHSIANEIRAIGTTCAAFAILVGMGWLIRLFGFPMLYKIVKRWPTLSQSSGSDNQITADFVCRAVERACAYTLKPALCLRREAASVALLRLHGIPATLAIGVNRLPFFAHAWTEINGRAVAKAGYEPYPYPVIERF